MRQVLSNSEKTFFSEKLLLFLFISPTPGISGQSTEELSWYC